MKSIIDKIKDDVVDIKNKNFEYISTNCVPSRHDSALTFESGVDKRGKIIETCVLYVDIRDSVKLNDQHHTQTMGRIYSVFSKAMLKLARHHQGSVRNIIGDRVMVVFPSNKCFENAVKCAISINHVAKYIINSAFANVNFRCGIGIDYGELKVVKVGLHRQGHEGFENKNLVWVGHPANIASRLTDKANKTINTTRVKVTYYPFNIFPYSSPLPLIKLFAPSTPGSISEQPQKTYQDSPMTSLLSLEDFAKSVSFNHQSGISYSKGKLVKFEKIEGIIGLPPILMTPSVHNGFKSACPKDKSITDNYWKEISNHNISDVQSNVYGGNVRWKI